MKTGLSIKELRNRIITIRKAKGLSQEDIASLIGISRSALAQIELGNRKISIIELMNLSLNLGISIDKILAEDFKITTENIDLNNQKDEKNNEERISVPDLMVDKFRNILLYILERCAGKANVGETVLYKCFIFQISIITSYMKSTLPVRYTESYHLDLFLKALIR